MGVPKEPSKGDPRFHALLEELGYLHDRKQEDYGADEDPFANIRASEEWGQEPWVGALMRANDKMHRLQRFAAKGELSNESAEDSMRDIAVYAMIALILYTEASENEKQEGTSTSTTDGAKDADASPSETICRACGQPIRNHTATEMTNCEANLRPAPPWCRSCGREYWRCRCTGGPIRPAYPPSGWVPNAP